MSDYYYDISSFSTQRSCDCYKRLQTYGIPLYISDENDLYGESQKKITFEKAFELPGVLRINENITEYLYVEDNELSNVFHYMAEVLPVLGDFEENILSFWILDVFIEGLWTAQNAKMNFEHQQATLLWIAYFFNYIQKENPTRRSLFDHLKTLLFHSVCDETSKDAAERSGEASQGILESKVTDEQDYIGWKEKQIWALPLPPSIEGDGKKYEHDEIKLSTSEEERGEENSTTIQSSEGEKDFTSSTSQKNEAVNDTLTNLSHLKVILEILYRIFGRLWVYIEIQTVFHAMPTSKQVDLPITLKPPKPLLKPDTPTLFKFDKLGRRPSLSDKSSEEIDPEIQLHKNDFILPLQVADESKLILKQFFPQSSSQRSVLGRKKT